MGERARRRELKHAGVLAARQARVDLAASIARLEEEDAVLAGGKALAQRLAFAVGSLYGAEVGEPEGVRDRLREASGVLSGVLAHLAAPGTPRALDDAGASIAKCLAILYPARAGLERELDASASAEAPIVELPAREAGSSLTRVEPSAEIVLPASESVETAYEPRAKRNTARGVAPSASGQGMAHDPAAEPKPPDAPLVVESATSGRRIPPTREHVLPPRALLEELGASKRTQILGGVGEPSPSAPSESSPPSVPPTTASPSRSPSGRPRPRRKALELVPDADEGFVDRANGSPLVAGTNRRASDRVTLTADIGLHSASQFFTGIGGDVSEGGVFVATWSPLALGTEVTVSFVLPGGHQVTATGAVAWLKEPRDSDGEETPGMGVRFDGLTELDRRAIERFLVERPALFHDGL